MIRTSFSISLLPLLLLSPACKRDDATSASITPSPSTSRSDSFTQYYLARESPDCAITAVINGQPAAEWADTSTGVKGVAHFLVSGKNHVQLTMSRDTSAPLDFECKSGILRESGETSEEHGFIGSVVIDAGSTEVRKDITFEFEATIPARWRWQDSDQIELLTSDDREKLIQLVLKLSEVYKTGKLDDIDAMTTPWWTKSRPDMPAYCGPPDPEDTRLARFIAEPDTMVTVVSPDEIILTKGTRLVRAHAKGFIPSFAGIQHRPMIWIHKLENDPDLAPFEHTVDELYFLKEKGEWKLLY